MMRDQKDGLSRVGEGRGEAHPTTRATPAKDMPNVH